MGETVRFGVSMDSDLVNLLDKLTEQQGHSNRSETLRALVRQELTHSGPSEFDQEVIGTVTLLYHYRVSLPRIAVEDYPSLRITANLQLHAQKEICIKILVVAGKASEVHAWAQKLLSKKNVMGKLTIAATEELYRELL